MTGNLKLVLTVLSILTCVNGAARVAFDCNRNGQDCTKGVCLINGTCRCTDTSPLYSGFACSILNSAKGNSSCSTQKCNGQGECVTVNNRQTCVCKENYYSTDCSLKRVDVMCIGRKMYLNMNTYGTFNGIAFMRNFRNKKNCVFNNVTTAQTNDSNKVLQTWQGLALILNLDLSECGNLSVQNTSSREYEAVFYIEYNTQFITDKDEMIKAKCVFNESNVVESKVSGVTVKDELYKGGDVEGNYDPIVFSLKTGEKPIPKTGLNIGSPLDFSFNIPVTSGFKTLLVKSIKASDGNTNSPTELLILENGCPTKEGSTVIGKPFEMDATNRTFAGKISLFKFVTSSDITFVCQVLICNDTNAAKCAFNCPAPKTNRRKREAEAVKEMTITKSVSIADNSVVKKEQQQDTQYQVKEDCLQRTEVLVTILTVSAFLVILLIVCLVLVCRMFTLRKQSKMSSFSDVSSSSLSIPRATVSYF